MTCRKQERLPLASLLALATAAFITILTEALPAGLLLQMAQGLAVSEAWVGQTSPSMPLAHWLRRSL